MDEETSPILFLLQIKPKAFSSFEPEAAKIRMANIYSRAFGQGPTPNDADLILNKIIFVLACFVPLQFLPDLVSSFISPVICNRLVVILSITR